MEAVDLLSLPLCLDCGVTTPLTQRARYCSRCIAKRHNAGAMTARRERHAEVTTWLVTQYFGATRHQIEARFPEHYTPTGEDGCRKLYRDLREILATGAVVRLMYPMAPSIYISPKHQHRAPKKGEVP